MSKFIPSVVGVICYAALISQMWRVWTHPTSVDNDVILSFAILMAFEFFLVHSGVFMSAFRDRKALLFFVIFYGLFAVAFNAIMPNNIVLYVYCIVVFNRMSVVFFEQKRSDSQKVIMSSVITAAIYVISIGVVVAARDWVPDYGLSKDFLESSGYLASLNVKGEFPENPKIAIAAGCLYYACLGVWEILQNFTQQTKH